ncbi:hypothetical protein AK830_g8471 [Neonectria ditissima]|uniref:Mid2 domain-containing protein n=1 Tax=Neonectria ditissima TaxID=78410 RepID=A0A0P7B7Z0_9HYPO|nr:hypothetical protein AK830_g8471 [Neonectria ditissima]
MDRLASSIQGSDMESLNDKANVVAQESATSTFKSIAIPTDTGGSGAGESGDSGNNPNNPGAASNHVSFVEPSSSVFALSSVPTQAFEYNTQNDVDIDLLLWQGWSGDINSFKNISKATFDDNAVNAEAEDPFVRVSASGATLDFSAFKDDKLSTYIKNRMRLVVNWHTANLTGNTTSPVFAIVNSVGEVADEESDITSANQDMDTGGNETIISLSPSTTADSTDPGNVSGSDATSSAVSGTNSSESDGDNSGGGGGGGLAKGAIAGIAVGAVIGVLLIGAMIWFFLRKRRQNKKLAGGYTGTDSAGTYMVDKETHGRTTDSPNSPYTDDNHNQHVPIDDSARDSEAIGTTERGGITRTSTSGSQGGRGSTGAQTPQGMSSNVAHLVEDGMTVDEIRRLEEEERQLDDEIERAARR